MATQYTPILQLALPVTGELNGTWGEVVNDNITSMVEEAIAGLATISTWTTNSHTLTTANGTTDEARCAMLVAQTGSGGSALTGVGEIICPDRTKLFVLQNASSYAVTLKTSAGTGIAVAAGDTAFLFCDGTNVNACVTQIINGHVTGNLTVDGNTTLGNSTSDTITATARVASDLNPSADNTYDLGTSGNSWRNLYIDGTATIATLNVTTIDTTNIEVTNIKAKDGTAAITIADTTGAVTVATDFAANGNSTLGNATSDTVTYNARAASSFLPAADNTYDLGTSGNSWKDVYADGTVNTTTVDTTNIEVTNIKAKDGSAAGSIADATGVVTLNSAVLTTADINGGTIDNATIGATTAAPGSFTQVNITGQGDLRLEDTTGGEYVALQAPGTLAASYTLTMPADDGTSGQLLSTDGSGNLSWATAAGDVAGPASATDNAIARFDGTTGKLIQNSAVTIDDDGATVIAANSSSDGLRITQTGTGNALLVEDSANPDSSPFVVDTNGNVIQGSTVKYAGAYGDSAVNTIIGIGYIPRSFLQEYSADVYAPVVEFSKSRGATGGAQTVVQSGDQLGAIRFAGSDGAAFKEAASIASAVDGTPGTNDMPGRLVFSTTADGASNPTERMRITNSGNVGIGGTPSDKFAILGDTLTGVTSPYSVVAKQNAISAATGTLTSYLSYPSTSAAAFTLAGIRHYSAGQGTIGAGSTVTNQYGFSAESSLTGATSNYGFYGNIAAGTSRWNFYAAGTAANYFAGVTSVGSALQEKKTAIGAAELDMSTGNYFSKTISTTTTFTVSNVPTTGTAMSLILDLTNGGSSTVTWWSGVKWASGTAPTLTASGRDVLGFFTYDGGTTWSGFVLGLNLS